MTTEKLIEKIVKEKFPENNISTKDGALSYDADELEKIAITNYADGVLDGIIKYLKNESIKS